MNRRNTIGLVAAAIAALGLAGGTARAQTKPPVVARAEQCLRQNVDKVVAADRDMASAATFLVTYACAAEVAGAQRYERNSAYVQIFATIFKSVGQGQVNVAVPGKPAATPPTPPPLPPPPLPEFKATVDPETGELVLPPAKPGAPANPMAAMLPTVDGLFGQFAPQTVPVGLRKLAGDLVLAAHARTH